MPLADSQSVLLYKSVKMKREGTMPSPNPDHIAQVAIGYGISKALLSAVGLGLHTYLAQESKTLDDIMSEFKLQRRPAMDWLDMLVSVDLLGREGDGASARYHNTDATAAFLDRNKPGYLGGFFELWDQRNYRFWADLTEAMQTGKAQSEAKHSGTSFF